MTMPVTSTSVAMKGGIFARATSVPETSPTSAPVAMAASTPSGSAATVEMAVYVRADGGVRTVVPRAIDCPTVEQFAEPAT